MTRRDRITDLGIAVVGAAAAVLTFTTLRDLALAVGIRGWQSWLVPVTVDAAGVVAARVWLRRVGPAEVVRFARRLALACIGLSVAGNAGQHFMAAFTVAPPWWVVVAVSAVPPAMLGAVVHLGHLTRRPATVVADDHVVGVEPIVVRQMDEVDEADLPPDWWADAPVDDEQDATDVHEQPSADPVAELIAAGAGRRRLARELGITEHAARELLAARRNGHSQGVSA